MAINIILTIAVIVLLVSLFISMRTNSNTAKDRDEFKKRLNEKEKEVEVTRGEIWKRNQEIHDLNNKINDIKKGEDITLKAFSVGSGDLEGAIGIIERTRTVSNKNKITLIKLLTFFLISNQTKVSLKDLKVNKISVAENARLLRKHFVYNTAAVTDKEIIALGSAVLTLICY